MKGMLSGGQVQGLVMRGFDYNTLLVHFCFRATA